MPVPRSLLLAALLVSGTVCAGDEVKLTPDYLKGSWSLDGKAGCGSSNARYVLFRDNGTLEVGRGAQVQRVGFWKIVENRIVANTLTAPAAREDYHPFFRDSSRYEYVTPQIVDVQEDAFSVSIGSDLEKEKRQYLLTRCP